MAVFRRLLIGMAVMIVVLLSQTAFALDAKVVACTGKVEYKTSSNTQWLPLAKDTVLKENDQISTYANSSCVIRIGQSAAELGPNAVATLTKTDPTRMDIKSGKIFVLVRNLPENSEFRVVSPTAICAARGTGWLQTVDEVQCFEGAVTLEGADGRQLELLAGQGVLTGTSGLGTPHDLSGDQMDAAHQQADQLSQEAGIPSSGGGTLASERAIEMEEQNSSHDISPSA